MRFNHLTSAGVLSATCWDYNNHRSGRTTGRIAATNTAWLEDPVTVINQFVESEDGNNCIRLLLGSDMEFWHATTNAVPHNRQDVPGETVIPAAGEQLTIMARHSINSN